jgi:hypothetical protein
MHPVFRGPGHPRIIFIGVGRARPPARRQRRPEGTRKDGARPARHNVARHFAGRAQTSAGRGRVTTHKRVRVGDTLAGRTYRCMASRDSKTLTGRIACSCQSSTKTKTMGAGYAGLMAFECVWSRSSQVAGPGRHCRASPCTECTAGARSGKVMPARQNGGRSRAPQCHPPGPAATPELPSLQRTR